LPSPWFKLIWSNPRSGEPHVRHGPATVTAMKDKPFYAPDHRRSERQPTRGFKLWSITNSKRVLTCELRGNDLARAGVDVQLLEDGELLVSTHCVTGDAAPLRCAVLQERSSPHGMVGDRLNGDDQNQPLFHGNGFGNRPSGLFRSARRDVPGFKDLIRRASTRLPTHKPCPTASITRFSGQSDVGAVFAQDEVRHY
jgi:hypothetical protein